MLKDDEDYYRLTSCYQEYFIYYLWIPVFDLHFIMLYLGQIIEETGEETSPEKTDGEDSTVIKKGICLNAEAGAL